MGICSCVNVRLLPVSCIHVKINIHHEVLKSSSQQSPDRTVSREDGVHFLRQYSEADRQLESIAYGDIIVWFSLTTYCLLFAIQDINHCCLLK